MANVGYVGAYLNRNIVAVRKSIWNLGIENYQENEILGAVDSVSFSEDSTDVSLGGWITFTDYENDTDEYEVYVCVTRGNSSVYYNAKNCERQDIADNMGSNKYLDTGFYIDSVGNESDQVTIYIVDRNCMTYGKMIQSL